MYNFNFIEDEKLIDVFDEVFVKQKDKEIITTIALTNKRLLFLDYINIIDGLEVLRIAKGISYTRYKEVYYQINLDDIVSINEGEYYHVNMKNQESLEFNNIKLYSLLKGVIKI